MIKSAAILGLVLILFGSARRAGRGQAGRCTSGAGGDPPHDHAGDHRLDYDAIAETFALTDQKGATTATIFTVSYLVAARCRARRGRSALCSTAARGRPRCFCIWARSGRRSWRRRETEMRQSRRFASSTIPATWLPFTDLVFIDPVGTGFSRGEGKEQNPDKPFWDVHADLNSLGAVVRLWLTRHERWPSPIYLVGESYGGFRAAAMARKLAARCRRDGQRARTDLAGARSVGAASERARPARRRLLPADLCRHRCRAARA